MRSLLAKIFRLINTNLLYPNNIIIEKLIKINWVISGWFYKGWMKSNPKEQRVTITDIDKNLTMTIDLSKSMGAAFYWLGFHELREWQYLQRFLTSEMTFIDIGANQGEFTLFSAKRLKKGNVLSFEPVDQFYELLNNNIQLNKFTNIKTFPFGLSNENKTLPIYMSGTSAKENEGVASIFQSEVRDQFVQNIDIRILDEVIPSLNLSRIDFIKIDVEGAEILVLEGATKTIETFRPQVMVEMSDATFSSAGYKYTDIIEFFNKKNYSMNRIEKNGVLIKTVEVTTFCNVIFNPN